MTREALVALGAGLASAIFYLSVRTGAPGSILLAYLAPLPLLAAGLHAGALSAAIGSAVATLALAVGTSFAATGMYLLMVVAPALIIVRQALLSRPGPEPASVEWYPPGLLLSILTGYGLALLLVAGAIAAGQGDGLDGMARAFLEQAMARLGGTSADPAVQQMLESLARFLPGIMISIWLIVTSANAAIAQGALSRLELNRRPSPAFSSLVLPGWMPVALAAAALASILPGQIGMVGRNALIVAGTPFLFLGLSVLHVATRRVSGGRFVLAVLYLVLILFGWPAALIVGLGVVEQWAHLRRRFAGQGRDQENE